MADENPSVLSHVSIGTNAFSRPVAFHDKAFYDKVLATLGCRRMLEHLSAVAYGKQLPEFWVHTPFDGKRAATSKSQVDAFHRAAIGARAKKDDGATGPRPLYGEPYYGCFVHDFDGHKIEAAHWAGGG